ncbi:response regulator [Candidatus Fukatsuia symbiotica]|uniref:DNA-binding response regulator n=1 Tax=Candidatus Fukatsuia symbiotica TaxID=1878942 RepID=A0A2U8I4B0_9GAMM|nr:response regulator [Candidatus Fukatsuia symbiotica]AWK13977.1 DNA-binding response regulator [Candidatus Fukatsuia symbiotica]MEA9445680.1 response regulator [Candidatus Fukatsuia symbiotica]
MNLTAKVKVVIADDHELIIDAIKNIINLLPNYQTVGQAKNGLEVYGVCLETEPDMIILDLGLPGMHGQDVITQLLRRWPSLRILVFTARTEEHCASTILNNGALGYVLKNSPQRTLLTAMDTVRLGKRYIDPKLKEDVVQQLMEQCPDSDPSWLAAPTSTAPATTAADRKIITRNAQLIPNKKLTTRERQVLKLITEGACNRIIADQLSISQKTVETHRLNMMRKLDAHKVADLVRCAYRIGLIY